MLAPEKLSKKKKIVLVVILVAVILAVIIWLVKVLVLQRKNELLLVDQSIKSQPRIEIEFDSTIFQSPIFRSLRQFGPLPLTIERVGNNQPFFIAD